MGTIHKTRNKSLRERYKIIGRNSRDKDETGSAIICCG
jgi:hypothetical protein